MIVAAAIQVRGLILSVPIPGRHVDVLQGASLSDWPVQVLAGGVYGFLTDEGTFLDRVAALHHVLLVKQPLRCLTPHAAGLYSEDLW